MDLFNCSAEELAKKFSENERLYENLQFILENLEQKINSKINLEKTIEKIDKAKNICSNGRYFLFSVYDSWCERTRSIGEGFELYKLVAGEMIEKIRTDQDVPQDYEIINYLKKNKINTIYNPTREIAGEFSGAEGYDNDQDGDCQIIKELSKQDDLSEFEVKGIKIIGIDFEDEDF